MYEKIKQLLPILGGIIIFFVCLNFFPFGVRLENLEIQDVIMVGVLTFMPFVLPVFAYVFLRYCLVKMCKSRVER